MTRTLLPSLLLVACSAPDTPTTDLPDPLIGAVGMEDVRWLENLWLGCHAVMPEYDRAWADHRLDEDDLTVVAEAVAREHAKDPEGRVCRYHHALPPVLRRTRLDRIKDALGIGEANKGSTT